MTEQPTNKSVYNWLITVAVLIMGMVVLGGYVRLTRSGLSIVEWDVISGILPPIGEAAWQAEFAQYQATPEFQKINYAMTLSEYKEIFYLEYIHRLIARFAGLVVALPLLYFLFRGMLPRRRRGAYIAVGLLFGLQGYLGWYMVSSGLVDRPSVSHFRLTIHLLAALLLLGITSWLALEQRHGLKIVPKGTFRTRPFLLSATLMLVLIIQIAWGGLMAGLKAGYASSTYPLMFGRLVPQGLLSVLEPWWLNLVSYTTTVHFIHRWFAIVVLLVSIWLYVVMRHHTAAPQINLGIKWMIGLTAVQTALGVSVIWFRVPLFLALTHQAVALSLFIATIYINYHVIYAPAGHAQSAGQPLSAKGALST